MTDWLVSINDGPEQPFSTRTGIYRDAAAAAFAMLPFEETDQPAIVKIWVQELQPDYPPFWYRMDTDEFGRRVVTHVIPIGGRDAQL